MSADYSETGMSGELNRIAQGDETMASTDKTQQTIQLIEALAPLALQLLQALEPGFQALGQQIAQHIHDLTTSAKPALTQS